MTEKEKAFTPLEEKLLRLQSLKEYIEYISDQQADYFSTVVSKSTFFYLSYLNAQNIFVIELCKLLNHSENDNLHAFLKGLSSRDDKIIWKNTISQEALKELKKRFNNVINGEAYIKAKDLRNMHIAHDDIKKHQFDLTVKFEDLWVVLKEIQDIYNIANFHLNDTRIHFDDMHNYGEIQNLERVRKIRELIYDAHIKNENTINTQELLMILRN